MTHFIFHNKIPVESSHVEQQSTFPRTLPLLTWGNLHNRWIPNWPQEKKEQKFDRFTASCLFVAWLWVVKCYCWSDASKHCTQICLLISFSAIIGATYRNLSIKFWSETPLLRIWTQDKIFWLSGFEKATSRLLHIRNYFTKIFNQIRTLLILTLRIATETDDVYLISKVISGSTISDEKSAVWKKGQSVYTWDVSV